MDRLTQGEQVSAGAGILLIISLFLTWYGADNIPAGASFPSSGWSSQSSLDIYLLILAGFAIAPAAMTMMDSGDLPMVSGAATFLLGVIGAILMFAALFMGSPFDAILNPSGIEVQTKFGFYIALLATLGVAVGGYLTMQEEGSADYYQ